MPPAIRKMLGGGEPVVTKVATVKQFTYAKGLFNFNLSMEMDLQKVSDVCDVLAAACADAEKMKAELMGIGRPQK